MKRTKVLIYILLAIGVIDSMYLVHINLNQTFCSINTSCLSEYSLTFAILGLTWFSIGFIVNLIQKRDIIAIWAFSGIAGALFLLLLMIAESYICYYCLLAHIIGITSAVLSLRSVS